MALYLFIPGRSSCVAAKYRPLSGLYCTSTATEALGTRGLGPWLSSGMSTSGLNVELETNLREVFTSKEKAPTRVVFWLKAYWRFHIQPGESPSRSLLRQCETNSKLREISFSSST